MAHGAQPIRNQQPVILVVCVLVEAGSGRSDGTLKIS